MAKSTIRHRSVAAAARAAAKRAERARADRGEESSGTPAPVPPRGAPEGAGGAGASDGGGERSGGDEKAGRTGKPELRKGSGRTAGGEDSDGAGSPRRGLLPAALAVLVAIAAAASAYLGQQYLEGERTAQARTEALAAARKAAPVVFSYHHKHLERDFKAARKHITGGFLEEYEKTTSTVVAPTAEKYKGVVKATVAEPPGGGTPAASVVSASPDKVVTLLFVNQVTENSKISGPRVDVNRVRMTMVRTSDGWKVGKVDAL